MDDDLTRSGDNPEIGDEPPEVSIGLIISTFRTRGIIAALNDEVLGPHNHLFFLLSIVFLITIIIGILQLAV